MKAAATYVPYQDLESKFLLADMLDNPDDLLVLIKRFTYSLSTQMIFGYRCLDSKDPNLLQLFQVGCTFIAIDTTLELDLTFAELREMGQACGEL